MSYLRVASAMADSAADQRHRSANPERPTVDLQVAHLVAEMRSLKPALSVEGQRQPTIGKPHLSMISWRPPIAASGHHRR